MNYQKGTYILVSDTQLRDHLISWAKSEFCNPTATARIIRNDPDYPDSLFLEVDTKTPLDLNAFNALFEKYDPEGEYDPEDERSLDGTYSMLPESLSLKILKTLVHKLSGISVKTVISYRSAEMDGILGLST